MMTAGCGGRTPSSVLTFYEESGSPAAESSAEPQVPADPSPHQAEAQSSDSGNEERTEALSGPEELHTGAETQETNILPYEEDGFRFGLLTAGEKRIYADLVTHISAHEAVFRVYANDSAEIQNALRAVVDDHPEFFWLSGSASIYGFEGAGEKEITLDFSMEEEAIKSAEAALLDAVNEYLSLLPEGASEYEKVKTAYEYIILGTDYRLNAYQGQNIVSALVFHESVCAGYSKAFQYLLGKAGVWCAYMTGRVTRDGVTEAHAWNMVRIDGTPVFVDITWGDPACDEDIEYAVRPDITYDYFCITTSDMVRTLHVPDDYYELPDCPSRAYDYYVLNGWYYENFDEEQIRSRMWEAIDQNISEVHFKFADFESYAQANAAIFDGEILYDTLQQRMRWDGRESITYSPVISDGLCTIDIYWQSG